MVCPFRLTICAVILIFAISSVFFHFYFSDDTVDYLLQWIPINDKTKDWLYVHLTSPTSQPLPPSCLDAKSGTNSTTPQTTAKSRPNRQFTRQEVPRIVKVLKYVTMGLIIYLHAELITYQLFSTCLTAKSIRAVSSLFTGGDHLVDLV